MTVMLWWIPPVIATLAAIAWTSVRSQRGERHPDNLRTDRELARMQKALERPLPTVPGVQAAPAAPATTATPASSASSATAATAVTAVTPATAAAGTESAE